MAPPVMANLSSLYGSPKKHKQKLPPVNAMFGFSSDHFDSEIFHGRNNFNGSFVCEESLQESPSTSNRFVFDTVQDGTIWC